MKEINLNEFDYNLPPGQIAQYPSDRRGDSRMMVVHRGSGLIEHKFFQDITDYIEPNSILVFNNSKVIKARLLGKRPSGGQVECFLLNEKNKNLYECLIRSSAKKQNLKFEIAANLWGEVIAPAEKEGQFLVQFTDSIENGNKVSVGEYLEQYGHIPLPPYIQRDPTIQDEDRYQTVYAKSLGSVAAPTAGLHFTPEILNKVKNKGAQLCAVTLHVGLGTFKPIQTENILEHKMHTEFYNIDAPVVDKLSKAKSSKQKIFAVGTTSVRCLESYFRKQTLFGETDLYLYPGEKFFCVDALITNFHQPKSSLLVLLSAFMGSELRKKAYEEAVKEQYRFLSYGDCMLVL